MVNSDGKRKQLGCELEQSMKTKAERPVKIKVAVQGGPVLNDGMVMAVGPNVVAIEVDMKSKRCEVAAHTETWTHVPELWISGDNALHLKKGCERELTAVTFPEYRGWQVFLAEISRYTLRVCLVRREKQD